MHYVIGIDIGTSGTKAIAYAPDGAVLNSAYASYETISNNPGESELDPDLLLEAVIQTIKEVVEKTGAENLLGIGFSCAMHSLMAIDGNGAPLTNIITWADLRSKKYSEDLRQQSIGKKIYEKTGTPIHPMSPLCKLMWFRDTQPAIFEKASKFISIKEYIWFHFFGKFLVDYSIASGTGLFDIYKLRWFEKALRVAGIAEDRLSAPVSPQHIEVNLSGAYQKKMGLPGNVPFIIGGTDGCLANLGSGAISAGEMSLTIATSGAARMASPEPKHDPKQRIFNYILTESVYISGGPVNNGGNTVKWYAENFMQTQNAGTKDFSELMQGPAGVPPGCDGLVFLPYLLGERAPIWDANARGVFFGITADHTSPYFLRAVMEGVGFSLYQIGLSLEQTIGPIKKIYASGGFIKSSIWLQMMADIFDRDVYVMNIADASAIGAAMISLYAIGKIKDLEETKKMIAPQQTYRPDKNNHAVYMKNFSVFERLYDKLKDEFTDK